MNHPAKFSQPILDVLDQILPLSGLFLDPFAGVGRIKQIRPSTVCLEIEPEWAKMAGGVCGDALNLPFSDESIDVVVTSPTYGNRMADHHNATDVSTRNTYRHVLGRKLHQDNSGQLQWGKDYREFHEVAWLECVRVLRPGGMFFLNIKNHIRRGKIQPVSEFHCKSLKRQGLLLVGCTKIKVPGNRYGANGEERVEFEEVYEFSKPILPSSRFLECTEPQTVCAR